MADPYLQGSYFNPQASQNPIKQKKKPIQGSSVNPQKTVAPKVLQTPQTKIVMPTSQSVALAAKQNAEKIKVVLATKMKKQLNVKVAENVKTNVLKVQKIREIKSVAVGRNYAPKTLTYVGEAKTKSEKEYQRIKNEAMLQAQQGVDYVKGDPTTGWWSKTVDKVTFGSDRRASGARKYAESQATAVADRQVKVYETKLDEHNKLLAKLQADFEAKKLKLSAKELNALADKYQKQMADSLKNINNIAAYTEGTIEGYGLKASEKIKSKPGQLASWFGDNVVKKVADNPIWKYTLGSGSKNVPSLVTAPSRLVNLVGNLNTKDRTIYKSGGGSENRVTSGKNAWQSTYNQRNVNLKPVTDKPYVKEVVWQELADKNKVGTLTWQKFKEAKSKEEKERIAQAYWDNKNKQERTKNSVTEIAADPLIALGPLAKVLKGSKFVSSLANAGKTNKLTSWGFKTADALKDFKFKVKNSATDSKLVNWLAKEHKTPEQQLKDAIEIATKTQGDAQKKLFPRIKQLTKKINGKTIDFSVFDDFTKLTDSTAKMLQRMRAGKLTARDRLMLAGDSPTRNMLETISKKWDDFSEDMRLADRVKTTRFGKGKQTYSPRTVWTKGDLKQYNFRLQRKKGIQNADDFTQGAIDRFIKSSLTAQTKGSKTRLIAERDELLKSYDDATIPQRAEIDRLDKKVRSPWNKVRKVASAPMRAWKLSVLKLRPAWTVNNTLYNAQAGLLAGGKGYIKEQAKMLNPRYARRAMDDIPQGVKTDLAKEIGGKGRLNKFYAGVENNPRVATFRALKNKGLSDAEALKRVDKYFFNYKTKNWERPIKAVVPFWQWQKNLAKASATMPFDRPIAALAYHRLEKHQQNQFEKDFAEVIPKLKEAGYTDEEIEKLKQEKAAIYAKRMKIGGKYYNTPFNAFSDKSLSNLGINPYLTAAAEFSSAEDQYGRKISGQEASLSNRLSSKFPQVDMGYKRYKGWRVDKGLDKPEINYIGKKGGEGYGMTKKKQGYDKTKPNYVASLDPRNKNTDDISAFLGKPKGISFDKEGFVKTKVLQKVSEEYFKKSEEWSKSKDFAKSEKERKKLFKSYGITEDDFYGGILSKYDTESAKKIKGMKKEASASNKKLFQEYAKQPKGTRNQWAVKKLKELVSKGYFDDNPFLKSFKWINSESVGKAEKQTLVQDSLRTGDWSKYVAKYGHTEKAKARNLAMQTGDWTAYTAKYGKTDKAEARDLAVKTGDWAAYKAQYGTKVTPYKYGGKYFKSDATMEKYKKGEFWNKYADSSITERRELLAKNPKYNERADWTADMWTEWKKKDKAERVNKLRKYKNYDSIIEKLIAQNNKKASRTKNAQGRRKTKRIAYA